MKKGASTAILMILVMLITVSLILMSYQWLLKYSPQTQEELESNLPQKEGCLKIESIDVNNKMITVRNCGNKDLGNFIIYLDSEPIATYSGTLNSGDITQISYNRDINFGNHEIFVSSNYAETNKIIFNIPSLPVGPCDFYIYQSNMTNTYSVTQSNKLYCLAENININNKNSINFSSGVQNTTLDCQGYNINGNDYTGTSGVYLTGASTKNNIINNCNVTGFYNNIYLYYSGPNNTVSNNKISNCDNDGIGIESTTNNVITNNIITMTKVGANAGMDISSSNNNIISGNTITTSVSGADAIGLRTSSNNNISNNNLSVSGGSADGIWIMSGSNSNTIFNNIIANNNPAHGIHIDSSSYNNITGGSVISTSGLDYYLQSAGTTNNFTSTNFTVLRNIHFEDTVSWFNYNNETTGSIWLKTNVSASSDITRKLTNWNQTLIKWNDTASAAITAKYNITGLLTGTSYNVYNNSVLVYTLPSGPNGQINFTISLSVSEREIKVQQYSGPCDFNIFSSSNTYLITQNNSLYCLAENININDKNAINFSSGVQNTTLDCQGYNIGGNDPDGNKGISGVYLTGINTKNNIIKNCKISNFEGGIYLYSWPSNNTIDNNNITSSQGAYAVWLVNSSKNSIKNNILNYNYYGIWLERSSNNTITNNTAGQSNSDGIWLSLYSRNNTLKDNVFNSGYDVAVEISSDSSNNTLTNNTANYNAYYGFIIRSDNNTLTNNTISQNGDTGIFMTGSYNMLTGNTLTNNQNNIYTSSTRNNTLTGSKINGGTYGIYMDSSGNNTISSCNVTDSYYGIYFYNSNDNNIFNTVSNSSYEGIYLYNSNSNNIFNTISNSSHEDGIYLNNSDSNNISNTTAWNNTNYGIYVSSSSNYNNLDKINAFKNNYGVYIDCSSNNILSNSNVYNNNAWDLYTKSCGADSICLNQITNVNGTENKPIYYHNGSAVNIIGWDNNVSEIILCNADGSKIDNVKLSRSGTSNNGIIFIRTDNSVINNTNLTGYENSIHLYESNYNSISNIISTSSGTGFYIYSSDSNTFDKIKSYSSTYRGVDIQGSTNCKFSNSQWIDSASTDIYVIPWSDTDCNLEITNVNGTENKPIYYHNGSAVNIIGWNNNVSEIILCNADGSKIDQVTLDRTTGYPQNNMLALLRTEYSIINNTVVRDLYQGLFLRVSKNNIVDNLTSESHGSSGVYIYEDSDNNTIKNSLIRSNNGCGVSLGIASSTPNNNKNNITYNSIYSNSNDYCISNGATDSSYFRRNNFTAARKIYFDSTSWFNYNNLTSGDLWLNTKASLSTTFTRELTSFTTSLIRWNDTTVSSLARNMTYQITNLTTSRNYEVRDNNVPILGSPFPSGTSGIISFVIELPGSQEHEIKVTML